MKSLLVILPILMVAAYTIVASAEWGDYEELPFDLFYGNIFAVGASIQLALAILGSTVFRKNILGSVWLLLAGGIFAFTVADVWYYYLELVEGYTAGHFVNTLWVLGNTVIIYALYKHKKTI